MAGIDDIDDYKSTGSVLEKLSLFEKLEQRQASTAAAQLAKQNSITSTTSNESPSNTSKSIRSTDKDSGMYYLITCVFHAFRDAVCVFFFLFRVSILCN